MLTNTANLDIFTVIEASCLISGDDPIQISICIGDTYFRQNNIEYLKAESFISAGIKSGKLDSDITRQSLQKFLLEKGYVIEGFNDNLPPATADKIGHATITQTMPTDSQLSQQVADLKAQLAKADDTIDRQAKEIAQLKNDYEALKQGYGFLETTNKALIEQAGKDTQSDTPADNDLFAKILDESNENHAIDLKYAINLWLDLYVINPRAHGEHSGNADTWLKKNTGYSELKGGDGSIKRIREIATPLKKFGSTRPKENQK